MSNRIYRVRNMKKCYLYTRVSTTLQVDGFSLEAQRQRLYQYAAYKELEVVGEYCDAGKSGKDIKGRPEFQKMLEDVVCQKDNISYVLVFKLSRFGRNAADVLKSMQLLMDYGIDLISVNDAIDSSTQGGRLTLTILSAVAEIERENIVDQFVAGKLQKILDGKWSGGSVPYGYRCQDKELIPFEEEAKIVRLIYSLYLQENMTITSVVSYLNENGYVRTEDSEGKEKAFTYDFIKYVLDNGFYCGKIFYNRRTNKKGRDGKLIKKDASEIIKVNGVHEPIITEEEWLAVQEKRKALYQRNKRADEPERTSLLSGLVKCPVCGKGMIAMKNKQINKNRGGYYKALYYYACNYTKKANGRVCSFMHRYNQEKVDSAIFEIIQRLSKTPEFQEAVITSSTEKSNKEKLEGELKQLRKNLQKVEMQKRKLGTELDNLDVFEKDYDKKYERIQSILDMKYDKMEEIEKKIFVTLDKIEALNQGVKSAENIKRMLDNFEKLYEKMSCMERRQMYRLFIERIEVFPEENEDGRIIKSISFRFSTSYNKDGFLPMGNAEDDIRFVLDCSQGEKTAAESKATYAEIKKYIKATYGVNIHTLYIAQIKRKYGLDMGKNYHLAEDPKKRVPQCPKEKEKILVDTLKHFKMLDDSVEMIESEKM